mmetsp:Transcript_5080/g.6215  ORF Transcript_5080/g.6215 Transcript_5080/m.6215 type:complete len:259 (-) Transcript_5080:2308-3084(-)
MPSAFSPPLVDHVERQGSHEGSSENQSRMRKNNLHKPRKAVSPKKSARKVFDLRKREEDRIKSTLVNHVPDNKRTKEMISILVDRLKSYKIAMFDYSDDYSREWFKTIYHLNRNLKLNKLNITGDMMLIHLRKKYSKIMADKIVTALNCRGVDPLNFTAYLGAIKSHMMVKGHREQLKFCFNLFDHDGDGLISPNDMIVLSTQFMGECSLLASDFIAMTHMFTFKQKYGSEYQMHLSLHPSNYTGGKSKRNSPMKSSP